MIVSSSHDPSQNDVFFSLFITIKQDAAIHNHLLALYAQEEEWRDRNASPSIEELGRRLGDTALSGSSPSSWLVEGSSGGAGGDGGSGSPGMRWFSLFRSFFRGRLRCLL